MISYVYAYIHTYMCVLHGRIQRKNSAHIHDVCTLHLIFDYRLLLFPGEAVADTASPEVL